MNLWYHLLSWLSICLFTDLSIYLITCAHASVTIRLTNLFLFISFIFTLSLIKNKVISNPYKKYRRVHVYRVIPCIDLISITIIKSQNELKQKKTRKKKG